MSLIDAALQVTPLDTSPSYSLPGGIDVFVSVLPPGVAIGITIPPLTIVLAPDAVAELVAALLAAAAELG